MYSVTQPREKLFLGFQINQPIIEDRDYAYEGKSQVTGKDRLVYVLPERDNLITEAGHAILKDRYLFGDESSPQEAYARVACAFSDNDAHAQRLYDYFSKQWAFPSTPVLANGGTDRGLPISCFINKVDDSREGLGDHYAENLWLSTSGGGVGTDWSSVRSVGTSTSKGNKTTGVIPFIKVADSLTVASWQGSTRRGATAVYLSVTHPEIEEFVEIRKPTGDQHRRSQNIHNAVSIPDSFMRAVEEGSDWNLVDPHTEEVVKTIDARELWMKILTTRVATGEPYLFFEDTANAALPQELKDRGYRIHSSNLCTEIMLPTRADRTAVCCLSSVNLAKYDEWCEDKQFVFDMLSFLDNVLSVFIDQAPEYMWRSIHSAVAERSVGLGAMGFHLFLQQKNVPFESVIASSWNRRIFKDLKEKVDDANKTLGNLRGSPPDLEGSRKRFAHTQAIAPNASISILCGETSPSIEPYSANAYTQKTQSGVFLIKNKVLDKLIKEKYSDVVDYDEAWKSIITNDGSVQHLEWMDDMDKEVFKTANEMDQGWVINHAADRQPFIDQGQSLNLYLSPTISKNDLHAIHKMAWQKGLKSLYYCRTGSVGKTETISSGCISCEG